MIRIDYAATLNNRESHHRQAFDFRGFFFYTNGYNPNPF
jgi:hypothetical protein